MPSIAGAVGVGAYNDAVLFDDDPFWWGEDGRDHGLRSIFAELLTEVDIYDVMPWGRRRRVERG